MKKKLFILLIVGLLIASFSITASANEIPNNFIKFVFEANENITTFLNKSISQQMKLQFDDTYVNPISEIIRREDTRLIYASWKFSDLSDMELLIGFDDGGLRAISLQINKIIANSDMAFLTAVERLATIFPYIFSEEDSFKLYDMIKDYHRTKNKSNSGREQYSFDFKGLKNSTVFYQHKFSNYSAFSNNDESIICITFDAAENSTNPIHNILDKVAYLNPSIEYDIKNEQVSVTIQKDVLTTTYYFDVDQKNITANVVSRADPTKYSQSIIYYNLASSILDFFPNMFTTEDVMKIYEALKLWDGQNEFSLGNINISKSSSRLLTLYTAIHLE